MRSKSKNKLVYSAFIGFGLTILAIAGAAFFLAPEVVAQVDIDPNLGTTFGLGTADLLSTVINIVQWALGFLGLVAVIFIMYGGFIWMTAAGNQEKVAKAKKIIQRAVIGLAIVLLAWAIVLFIVDRTSTLSGGGGSSCTFGDVNGCYDCDITNNWVYNSGYPGCGLGGGNPFYVQWTSPSNSETNVVLCSIVQAKFNAAIDPTSVSGNAHFIVDGGALGGTACVSDNQCASALCTGTCQGDEVSGAWNVSADILEFLPDSNYLDSTTYRVDLDIGGIDDATPPAPDLDAFAGKSWTFTTGSTTLTDPPTVTAINPLDNESGLCLNTPIQAIFSSNMRVSSINTTTVTFDNITSGSPENLKTPFGFPNPKTFSTRPASLLTAGNEYSVGFTAGTTGDNDPLNGVMDVCLNHLDGNYNTVDEGTAGGDDFMSINDNPTVGDVPPWNFFADTDTTNTTCTPEITSIVPSNGQYQSAASDVTIAGSNLGIGGNVFFNNQVMDAGTCFDGFENPINNCVASWAATSVTSHVPGGPINFGDVIPSNGARDGGVYVKVAGEDSNLFGFNVNSPQIQRTSGLNNQPHGGTGQFVTLVKRADGDGGFGAISGQVFIWDLAGNSILADSPTCSTNWTDSQVLIKIPDIAAGLGITPCNVGAVGGWQNCPSSTHVGIQVWRNGASVASNIIEFIYTDEPPGPGLCEAVPSCGLASVAVTLNGDGFGSATGEVFFNDPPVSAPISSWGISTIGIQVPNLDNGNYSVNVQDASGQASNAVLFDVPCGDIPSVVDNPSCSNVCSISSTACTDDTDCGGGPDVCVPSMASPNPYRTMTDACLNAVFGARFTTPMAPVNSTTIKLDECTDGQPCTTTNPVPGVIVNLPAPDDDRFKYIPSASLNPDTYYRMTISKEVQSTAGVKMNADYVWSVKTKNDPAPCPLESILVSPSSTVLYNVGDTQAYVATPTGPNCILLNASDYTWGWTSDDPSIASVTGSVVNTETATANLLGTTYINALAEGKTSRGRIIVDPDSCVFDPTRCSNPLFGGCGNSICDVTLDKCTPWIENLNPTSGPPGSFDSVNGCWFGDREGELIYGGQFASFECSNSWSKDLIVGTVPSLTSGTKLVEVRTASGNKSTANDDAVAIWHMDEASGSTIADASGNGNTGTLQPGATWTKGEYNSGVDFDGPAGLGHILAGSDSSINSIADALTVEGWVLPRGVAGEDYFYMVSNTRDCCGSYAGYELGLTIGGTANLKIWDDTGTRHSVWSITAVPKDQWSFISGTFDGTDLKIFINGQLNNTLTLGSPVVIGTPASFPMAIGGLGANPSVYNLNGKLDEIRIYDRAKTDVEIADNYVSGLSNVVDSGQDGITFPSVDFDVTSLCASLCAGGANANAYCTVNADCDSGVCSPGVPPPLDGGVPVVPGICPPLNPASGKEGTNVIISGSNLKPSSLDPDPAQTRVYYTEGLADDYAAITGRGAWADDKITDTQVPVGTQTGDVIVQVNNCPSNAINFGISCNLNGECDSGCCLSNICQDAALCSAGGAAALCQIEENLATAQSPENPNCSAGPITSPSTDYSCISNTGDTSLLPPPPPAFPDASYGDDCRFCCTPGQISLTGLTCVADQGSCVSDAAYPDSRGLYCGCDYDNKTTGDAQCDPTATGAIGCGFSECCYPKPDVYVVIPSDGAIDQCKNTYVAAVFWQSMNRASFRIGQPLSDDAIGVWHMDEGNGLVANDSAGSNNGNLLPDPGGPVWSSGRYSSGLTFDGVDDFVDAGNTVPDPGNGSFSISLWQKRSTGGTRSINKGTYDTPGGVQTVTGWYIRQNSGDLHTNIVIGDGDPAHQVGGFAFVGVDEQVASNDNKWHHFTAVIDRGTESLLFYKDGVLQGSRDIAAFNFGAIASVKNLVMGAGYAAGPDVVGDPDTEFFDGKLDEARIYARALSATEVADNYKAMVGNFELYDDITNDIIPVNSFQFFYVFGSPDSAVAAFPVEVFGDNQTVRGVIKGRPLGGVLSDQGVDMTQQLNYDFDGNGTNDSYSWTFTTGSEICQVDHLKFESEAPLATTYNTKPGGDLFTCAQDTCPNDTDGATLGNQHILRVEAQDKNNTPLTGFTYTFSEGSDPLDVIGITNLSPTEEYITANNQNGLASVKVEATSFGSGNLTDSVKMRVLLCENPWPNPFPPDNDELPYQDSATSALPKVDSVDGFPIKFTTNFSTWYCRDDGVGALNSPSNVVIREGSPMVLDGKNELIKEYFFLRAGSDDAIGIRVMENETQLSPTDWYFDQFGRAAPTPQKLTVDGYQAVRAGRTVYVGATNLVAGSLFSNVYLISYNEGATEETLAIYNRLLSNWEFNFNMDVGDKEKLQRDMRRINDLNDIYSKLLDYKGANNFFPLLEGGTYVQNMSTSKWPSWQDTLGVAAGSNLPVDPINTLAVPHTAQCLESSGYDQSTCWDDTNKRYECPGPLAVGDEPSFTYQYLVNPTGETANLYTWLEYEGPGTWITGRVDPCSVASLPNATCDCFNYKFDLTGSASDREGPDITDVAPLVEGAITPLNGLIPLIVSVTDVASGVGRVEFFVDGIRQLTDSDGTDGWSWDFNSALYPDGLHNIAVHAYDTVGNKTVKTYQIDIQNSGGVDNIPPFVSIVSHSDNDVVSGAAVPISAISSDNQVASQLIITIYNSTGAVIVDPGTTCNGATSNLSCPYSWNTELLANGIYTIRAEGIDAALNNTIVNVLVTVDNPDVIDPVVNITVPTSSPPSISSVVDFTAIATDNIEIDRVDFFIDGVFRGSDPYDNVDDIYIWTWDTKAFANGFHELIVYAYDTYGNFGFSVSITVEIDNPENDIIPPVVSFIPPTPANNSAVDGIINITVDAIDDRGVAQVFFYVDFVKQSTDPTAPWSWALNTATLSDGWHRIQVDAVDAVGNRSDSIEVRVNVRGPGGPSIASALVNPASGAPGTLFCHEADVTDDDGIARVQAVIQFPDETEKDRISMTLVSGDTYHGDWDSSGFDEEPYFVDIEAEDNLGNISELENIPHSSVACLFGPQPPTITSSLSFTAFNGTPFSYFIIASNSPTSYACSGAGLPAWVSCNTVTGEISGTPPSIGSDSFDITATNAIGSDTKTLTITAEASGGVNTLCEDEFGVTHVLGGFCDEPANCGDLTGPPKWECTAGDPGDLGCPGTEVPCCIVDNFCA